MSEREFLRLVSRVRRIDDPAFLDLPLEQAPFDSLELLALRAALEVELDQDLSDERFLPRSTLRDLYRQVAGKGGAP